MDQQQHNPKVSPGTAARNKRLAIILALVALAFYVGFILLQVSK
ncbi:MAG TPA: cytochrome oxidase small assembly protein [Gammaproteobacteria bacterium]